MLSKVKLALLISSTTFDAELTDLIASAIIDLNIAGVDSDEIASTTDDEIVQRAIISYCAYNFMLMHGALDRADAYKRIYDEQKAQLSMADGYTTWSSDES